MSLQQPVAVMLVCLFAVPVSVQARQPVDANQALKTALIEIPEGSLVKVRLKNRHTIQGKLGLVTDTGFAIQVLSDGKVASQTLALDSVSSVKFQDKGMHKGVKIALWAFAITGVVIIAGIVAIYAHGGPLA